MAGAQWQGSTPSSSEKQISIAAAPTAQQAQHSGRSMDALVPLASPLALQVRVFDKLPVGGGAGRGDHLLLGRPAAAHRLCRQAGGIGLKHVRASEARGQGGAKKKAGREFAERGLAGERGAVQLAAEERKGNLCRQQPLLAGDTAQTKLPARQPARQYAGGLH